MTINASRASMDGCIKKYHDLNFGDTIACQSFRKGMCLILGAGEGGKEMLNLEIKKPAYSYRLLSAISMLYFALMVFMLIFYKKLIVVGGLGILPVTVFISPLFFLLSDLIAEVYGFRVARNLLYSALFILGGFVLALLFTAHLTLPIFLAPGISNIPNSLGLDAAYQNVFSGFFKLYLIYLAAILISDYINIWALSRWKVLLKGRFFWMRSVGASCIGLFIYSAIATGLSPYLVSIPFIGKLILIALVLKVIFLIVLAYPLIFCCALLKRIEGVDVFDHQCNYNPFMIQESA